MASFKLTCLVENEKEGVHKKDIFVKDVENEDEAEKAAKYYFILEKEGYIFYKVTETKKM